MSQIELGDEVKDTVTGFKGIAVARTQWLYGCDRITVQPPLDKHGKHPEAFTFDDLSLVVTKKGKAAPKEEIKKASKTGGPQNDKAALRRN